jgi:hypothetical protein
MKVLSSLVRKVIKQGERMFQEIEDLSVQVEEQTGVIQSTTVLITGLHQMLLDVLSLGDPQQIKAKLLELTNKIGANKQALVDAAAANPLPTPPPPPEEPPLQGRRPSAPHSTPPRR